MPYGRYYYKSIFIEANTILGNQDQDHSDPITVYGIGLYEPTSGVDIMSCTKKVEYYYRIGFSFGKQF